MSRVPMTVGGAEALRAELENLKKVERPRIVKAIAEAREHGDLKENAEYHAAREKQGFIEGRILDLEDKVARAHVVDPTVITSKEVRFSATVTLTDLETDKELRYMLVSEYEADIHNNLISVTSPIARGLLGKKEGDGAEIFTPKGKKEYEIIKVEYKNN